jgi:hypothetical protein
MPLPFLYFAFPDGVFDYVCAECNALCCRGQGFGGSLRREMATLLTLYPSLESLATRRRGDVVHVATFRERCQFLEDDRRCRIEREHGKALKPGVCNLFPFNAFSRIGAVLVVSPHFMCPLRMRTPAAPGEVAGTHAEIESAIEESGLIDAQSWRETVEPARLAARAATVLDRETRFRDRCAEALGRASFRSILTASSSAPALHLELTRRALAAIGIAPPAVDRHDAIDEVLLAISASFRLRLLDLTGESMLLALALGERLVRDAAAAAMGPPTPQSAFSHLVSMAPLLKLMGRTRPLGADELASVKIPPFGQAQMTSAARTLLAGLFAGQPGRAAAEAAVASLPARSDRVALLVEMGRAVGA